ncbi:3-hydroxyacyl-CoA dehydrogenase NAD-binding domain-containing protein [Roseiconus lacunae]|uniref:3-hydroxyacyl-CoA dehydrogenase NAD-binding domain-containing protein n=1 Tax=Roseiconus lacunae TaxID=2605694 RepID=UPI00308EA4F5|nr:3-hydroxyacyl-CoA dehydrogenase NAD-binding domain-containing protein [Stieleria sp. HD01]
MTMQTFKTMTVNCDDAGVMRIVIDVPGRPLNIIDAEVMKELDHVLDEIEHRDDLRLVVFKSGKESGFFAGADVSIIEGIETEDQADQLILAGQRLFDRIERLAVPTLVEIHGPCLGGGLELSLACDYRIARDNSSTKIGLPEIRLGLIPGWGGTQRLTRLVGLKSALDLILKGTHLDAKDAAEIGLVDRAIDPDRWRDELIRIIDQLSRGRRLRRRVNVRRRLFKAIQHSELVRRKIFAVARRVTTKQNMHYPALQAAVHAIADSFRSDSSGYDTEREEFKKLLFTPTCRNLLRLFFSREKARQRHTWTPKQDHVIHDHPIRKIGVVGGGVMGTGIAHCAATRGFNVMIKEVDPSTVDHARKRTEGLVGDYVRHKRLDSDAAKRLLSSVKFTTDSIAFSDAECVVEAVVERMDVKTAVLDQVEQFVSNAAIVATNTSALSVTEMARSMQHPERFAGLHFFNPVGRMELVEVVRGERTSDATVAKLVGFVKALGKTPVVTKDSPGFIVNRILFPYLGEAMLMVQQGDGIQEIDSSMKSFGMPMGPLRLLDKVGLDVALHVARTLQSTMPAVSSVIGILSDLVDRGELGNKTGKGFYDYSHKRPRPRSGRKLLRYFVQPPPSIDFIDDGLEPMQRRLVYPMLLEAKRCLAEGVVEEGWAIDLAMVLGTGFAPHRGGPMQVLSSIGMAHFHANLARLTLQLGDRFADTDAITPTSSGFSQLQKQGDRS